MKDYPKLRNELNARILELGEDAPGPLAGFRQLNKEAMAEGVLSTKVKELIALGIAITVRCDGCIAYHVHNALRAKASRAEIVEAIGVAVMMGGGPSLMYGAEALEALEQFGDSSVAA